MKIRKTLITVLLCSTLFAVSSFAETTGDSPIIGGDTSNVQETAAAQTSSQTQQGAVGPGVSDTSQTAATTQTAATAQTSGGRQIDPSKPMVAITYDDGPCTGPGYRIIETFEKYGQRCTFFVVGDRLSTRVDELQRIVSSGFELGNHSYDHAYFNTLTTEQIQQEVAKCNAAIEKYAGVTPKVMRLPGGTQSEKIRSAVNMPIILWNIDTLDWKTRNADSTVSKVLGKVKDGDIILMHELYYATADATDRIVPELVAQGFQLVTVSELAQYKGISLENSKVYYSF